MAPLLLLNHLLNFLLPALAVAAMTSAAVKLMWPRRTSGLPWWRLAAWSAVAGVAALVAALVLLGRDGTMAGYGLLVVAVGAVQAVLLRQPRSGG